MTKIAQIVLTKTKNGSWKITAMSLKQTEVCHVTVSVTASLIIIEDTMKKYVWEQISLDV